MSLAHMTLEEFILSDINNAWLRFNSLASYCRKGTVVIDGIKYTKVLTRANTNNKRRKDNVNKKEKHRSTGLYRQFDQLCAELARKYEFSGVYVENVINDFLPSKLLEMGYQMVNYDAAFPDNPPCFWKPVNQVDSSVKERNESLKK